ncbi:MAG: hypothetical protein J6033_02520 [Lachnospiraceae bacterium]|nr:hypothetical protein [Lachnospiraceae bacterium]
MSEKKISLKSIDILLLLILILYPLRHINIGIDLQDTGYSMANFRYFSLDHVDPMWYFSTFFANTCGYLLSKFPFGSSFIGLNAYTALSVSLASFLVYRFATKKLNISAGITFIGIIIAESLCWCPTADLYNYLTYLFLTITVILVYKGIMEEKNLMLFLAGAVLGANIFVRFSNLPEAILIVAVWGIGVFEKIEDPSQKGAFKRTVSRTLFCLFGYLATLALVFLFIQIKYGFGTYIEAITRLLGMTDTAKDYTPQGMLFKVFNSYIDNIYWINRIIVFMFAGIVSECFVMYTFKTPKWASKLAVCTSVLWAVAMTAFLIVRGYTSLNYRSYDPMILPATSFLILTLAVLFVVSVSPKTKKGERLIAMLVFLEVFVTSIGSNNGLFPSFNNLFLGAVLLLYFLYGLKDLKPLEIKEFKFYIPFNSVKVFAGSFLLLCFVQFFVFGLEFTFAEATGVKDTSGKTTVNRVLKGVKMDPQKAKTLDELTEFIYENSLSGKEVILYGDIPSMSFYLEMPAAFNNWSDLESYKKAVLEEELSDLDTMPVIIFGRVVTGEYEDAYLGDGAEYFSDNQKKLLKYEKYMLIKDFMAENDYEQVFENESYAVYFVNDK